MKITKLRKNYLWDSLNLIIFNKFQWKECVIECVPNISLLLRNARNSIFERVYYKVKDISPFDNCSKYLYSNMSLFNIGCINNVKV